MKTIQDLIKEIILDRQSGASELAVRALQVIKSAILAGRAVDKDSFTGELREVTDILAGCRPSMAAIKNCVRQFNQWLEVMIRNEDTLEALKCKCQAKAADLEIEIISNKKKSIDIAADFISTSSVIVTCSYSSTLIRVLQKAAEQGKELSLHILQSQAGTISYGQKTRQSLESYSLDCRIVDDNNMEESLEGADIVLLGSDTVFRDGSIVNGYPSLKLAALAAAHDPPVPVYAISDSSKFSLDAMEHRAEPGFDMIPCSLLSGLISEDGLFKGARIIAYLESCCRI